MVIDPWSLVLFEVVSPSSCLSAFGCDAVDGKALIYGVILSLQSVPQLKLLFCSPDCSTIAQMPEKSLNLLFSFLSKMWCPFFVLL